MHDEGIQLLRGIEAGLCEQISHGRGIVQGQWAKDNIGMAAHCHLLRGDKSNAVAGRHEGQQHLQQCRPLGHIRLSLRVAQHMLDLPAVALADFRVAHHYWVAQQIRQRYQCVGEQ
jgi:hypothetical protein